MPDTVANRPIRPRQELLEGLVDEVEGGFVPARTFYTQLPMLHPAVETLADSLMRGLSNDYDRATSLVEWFQSEFTYSLNLPATAEETSLDHFLFHRRAGHCEYFSSAMVIWVGYPSTQLPPGEGKP